MQCPVCGRICPDDDNFCIVCGTNLKKERDKRPAATENVISREVVSSEENLKKTVRISFDHRSDDGIIPLEDIPDMSFPLYYTQNQILNELVRNRSIPYIEYHYIPEFHTQELSAGKDGNRSPVLAEVLSVLKSNRLTVIYGHRAEMVSRAGPDCCLYGCPAASEIEKKYAGIKQTAEIIRVDE